MAIKTFEGEIAIISKREVKLRNGPGTAYSAKVVKPDGVEYDEWIGFGFKEPDCKQGDSVIITAKQENGYWKAIDVQVTKVATVGAAAPAAPASGPSGSTESSASSAPQASSSSKRTVDQNIHYQNSRSAAIELTDLLLKHDAVPLSKTTGKAGQAARYEELTALVNKLTVILYHDLATFRLVNDIADVYEVPVAEPGFDPDPESGSEE